MEVSCLSLVVHLNEAYPGVCSMKQLEVFLFEVDIYLGKIKCTPQHYL